MLIDYISVEKLPWVVVWLDWMFYAYRLSFIGSLLLATAHYWYTVSHHTVSDLPLILLVGFCIWVVWCGIRYGYAVG